MKRVRGRTLRQAIVDAHTLEQRMGLLPHFVDVCQAIAYAHSRGVIHRDIKPANIMLVEQGGIADVAKVLDASRPWRTTSNACFDSAYNAACSFTRRSSSGAS